MRRDLIIDGLVFGSVTLKGDDSTQSILEMFMSLKRNDVNCIMLGGIIISQYNMILGEEICEKTGIPVVALTYRKSRGLEVPIKRRFGDNSDQKLRQYRKLQERDVFQMNTGCLAFVRYWGLSLEHAMFLLNSFTLQGSIPEPIRVARLAARANQINLLLKN
jgi:endonuclease V-like protein UPF0215 family